MQDGIAHDFSRRFAVARSSRTRPAPGRGGAPAGAPTAVDPSPGGYGHACCAGASR